MRESLFYQTMELKEVMNLSQQDLSEMAGISLSTVKDIERGKGNPSLSTVDKILEVLGIEIEYKIRQTI